MACSRPSTAARRGSEILFKDTLTGCSDIDVNPTNSNEIYAGMYTYLRQAWHLRSGGGETALYKSMDGGATWKKLDERHSRRCSIASASPSRAAARNIVYMISETPNYEGELWRSDDAGASWRVVNKDPQLAFRPFYYSDIRVDPNDPNRVYSLWRLALDVGRRRPEFPHHRPRRARRPPGAVDRSDELEARS